jgi:NAD(P)H-flavin reductase
MARVTAALLSLHAGLYLNFFVERDRLDRLVDPVVLSGVIGFGGLLLIATTALRPVRRYSYRLFFVIHFLAGVIVPVLIVIHATPARTFLFESLGVFFLDLVSRKMDTVTGHATVESISGTNLVKVSASIPHSKVNRFRARPGSHIYLSIPAAARKSMSAASASHLLFEFMFNPFTVAAMDEESPDLTLVARHCSGPMTAALRRFAGVAKPTNPNATYEHKIPLSIEGPYGAASRLSRLRNDFDRILLVAGGVGATFTLPLYRAITNGNPTARVEMVWAVRSAGDATWAVTGKEAQTLLRDDNIHIFVTGEASDPEGTEFLRQRAAAGRTDDGVDGEVEMSTMHRDARRERYTSQHNRKRPDLQKIVDDLFRYGHEERVAVLVCGPSEMARELRVHLGVWVHRGRSVWYHKEGFGF